jgi:acetyl esterase/lipase
LNDNKNIPPEKKQLFFVLNITSNYPSTVLVHGTADTTVPAGESDDIDAALTKMEVEHTYLRVEGKEHGLDLYPDQTQILDFIRSHSAVPPNGVEFTY